MYNYFCVVTEARQQHIDRGVVRIMEKYSRGRRGAPAKGVGRVTGARAQIPLSPFFYQYKSLKKLRFFFFGQNGNGSKCNLKTEGKC